MRLLFPALQRRFKADDALRRLGKALFQGFSREPLKSGFPYVEADATNEEPLRTFGVDGMALTVGFQIHTHAQRTRECEQIMEQMRRVFDAASIKTAQIVVWKCELVTEEGPSVEAGVRKGLMEFDVAYDMRHLQPIVRYA